MNLSSLSSDFISVLLFAFRIAVPLLCIVVAWRCFTSMRLGKRREEPVVVLEDMTTHHVIPVLYWENSLGRSRSCDIVLQDQTASRAHAVLMRRESGWLITDTDSKAGTFVNGKKVKESTPVLPGDVIAMGSTALMLKRTDDVGVPAQKPSFRRAAPPLGLISGATLSQILLALQVGFASGKLNLAPMIPLGILILVEWIFYFYSIKIMKHVSFELETIAFLLSGVGLALQAGADLKSAYTQLAAVVIGVIFFRFMIWFLGDMDRVMQWRVKIGILAILLFIANLLLAKERNGARNWIAIGPFTLQPSEFVKIAFIIVGTSTLDRLQTYKNLTGFIGFSAICMAALFFMKDFGTACIFFVTFLIIAFMRSGSVRTIALACAVAGFGAFLILKIKPYVAQRFDVWRHVWEHTGDAGYQQVRVLSYSASGGLFGVGIGKGCLKDVFASTSDLAFGMMCEEMGLAISVVIVLILAFLALYARSDATRSRSTLYSIAACAAGGMLLFQACLNIFGATDVLPMTGVTLPFISLGGSSMISVWGLLAFLKASDERTYAARRRRR
ncbi:MAG TPA: FtsW/RodA/SpoVE family cell cycle protein [Caproicibacter sp.]|nr:FtsW/RodA/SpoVE family cell cycle protein [Caproicibacter sp.]